MRKNKNLCLRVLGIICVFTLLVSCFTGCSKGKETAGEITKITYYYPSDKSSVEKGMNEVFEKLNKISREKIGVEVSYNPINMGEYQQKVSLLLATKEPCDVMFTSAWLNSFNDNVYRQALIPIDELLTNNAPKLKASIPEKFWNAAKVDGKIYGVINQQIFARQSTMVYGKEIAEKAGVSFMLIPVFAILSRDGIISLNFVICSGDNSLIGSSSGIEWIYSGMQENGWETPAGTNIPGAVNENLKVFNQFKTPEFAEYVTTCKDFYLKGYMNNKVIDSKIPNENIYAMSTGTYKPGSGVGESESFMKKPVILAPYGKKTLTTEGLTATMTGITTTSKNPNEAMKFLELMNTDKEFYNTLCYGIEGRDYAKTDDKHIEYLNTALYKNPFTWVFGNQFNAYLTPGMPDDAWDKEAEFNNTATPSKLLGFTFKPDNVVSEISNCNAVIGEYMVAFAQGTMDINVKLPEFNDKLDKAGADKIIAELQQQIDSFIK